MDCLFCKIKNKEIEAKVLYEDDDFFVFLDMDQSYGGHTLIILYFVKLLILEPSA